MHIARTLLLYIICIWQIVKLQLSNLIVTKSFGSMITKETILIVPFTYDLTLSNILSCSQSHQESSPRESGCWHHVDPRVPYWSVPAEILIYTCIYTFIYASDWSRQEIAPGEQDIVNILIRGYQWIVGYSRKSY